MNVDVCFRRLAHFMMLGSKGILPPMIHGLLRISCSRNPKIIRNPPCSGYFLMFYGSQSHAFSCRHETHNLLTLISFYFMNVKTECQSDRHRSLIRSSDSRHRWKSDHSGNHNFHLQTGSALTRILLPENNLPVFPPGLL